MSALGDWAVLAALQCPAGGLCDCRHDSADPRFTCPHCGCDCPLPDPHEQLGGPDDCACCHEDQMIGV